MSFVIPPPPDPPSLPFAFGGHLLVCFPALLGIVVSWLILSPPLAFTSVNILSLLAFPAAQRAKIIRHWPVGHDPLPNDFLFADVRRDKAISCTLNQNHAPLIPDFRRYLFGVFIPSPVVAVLLVRHKVLG